MSEKEKMILETFQKVIPVLSEMEKEKLLAFGEGMAFKAEQQRQENLQSNNEITKAAV